MKPFDMDQLCSSGYRALLTEKHDKRPWGGGAASLVPVMTPRIGAMVHTILDYGCGRGTLKPALHLVRPDLMVREYDPGVRGKDEVPQEPADLLVCTDVLEHIEVEKISAVLWHIGGLASHECFINVVYTPSKSCLPDGRNTHILQRPSDWWSPRLAWAFPGWDREVIEDGEHRGMFYFRRVR